MDTYLAEQRDERRLHNDHPITGWPLPILADLDRRGARGLLADLAVAGALSRQAAYIVAIDADLDQPTPLLERLGIRTAGAEGVGEALRTPPRARPDRRGLRRDAGRRADRVPESAGASR